MSKMENKENEALQFEKNDDNDDQKKLIILLDEMQKQMVPDWNALGSDEQSIMHDLYNSWSSSIKKSFEKIKRRQKSIINLGFNEKKMIEKGKFDFDSFSDYLKNFQLQLLSNNKLTQTKSTTSDINYDQYRKTKLNSRLLIKSLKQ